MTITLDTQPSFEQSDALAKNIEFTIWKHTVLNPAIQRAREQQSEFPPRLATPFAQCWYAESAKETPA